MMKVLKTALVIFLSLFVTYGLHAQMVQDNSKWTFEAKKKSGNKYELIVHLKLPEKWHIYSLKPGGDGSLISPSFTFSKNSKVTITGDVTEHGKLISEKMDGIDGIVNMYKGSVTYIQTATITGNTKITGTYSYQICNDEMCLPPKTMPFSIQVKDAGVETDSNVVTATAAPVAPVDSTSANASTTNAGAVTDSNSNKKISTVATSKTTEPKPEQQSLLLLFFLSFGGGLFAVVTPCVFSMIPITVSFFTKRSKTRQEGIKNAIYYSLSIIIIFTVFGLLISSIFGRNALYNISTNWVLNIIFFLLFIVFGISFLGAFEITLPSSWTNKTDSKAGVTSFSGIFFMALTLVIVSFSCTGPILTMLFALAASGGILGPVIGMFAFSLGLSMPFALCAIFPAAINKLGKAGGWLNQIKVTLGFIEIALAFKFFSNADLLKQWRILDREVFLAIWIVIAVLLGFYLLGKLKLSHDDEPKKNVYGQEYVSTFKLFLAIASFTFALYLLPGMWGAPLNGMGQFIPNMGTQDFVLRSGENAVVKESVPDTSTGAAESKGIGPVKFVSSMAIYEPNVVRNNGLVTYFDYQEALTASRKQKKPLMLDFTGITCVNCRKMETSVWSNPEVIKRLKNDFIIVSLYDDARNIPLPKEDEYVSAVSHEKITTLGDRCLDLQIGTYDSNAQPFYFFVDGEGHKLVAQGYGYDPDVQKFVAHLEKVKENYKKTHP